MSCFMWHQKCTMVMMNMFAVPTEGVLHTQPNTEVFFGEKSRGNGTLYVAEE